MVLEHDVKLGVGIARWVEMQQVNREQTVQDEGESEEEGEILSYEVVSMQDEGDDMERGVIDKEEKVAVQLVSEVREVDEVDNVEVK